MTRKWKTKLKLNLNSKKILLVLIVSFVFVGSAGAEDWPMFMHDLEHTGETLDVIEPKNIELNPKIRFINFQYQ